MMRSLTMIALLVLCGCANQPAPADAGPSLDASTTQDAAETLDATPARPDARAAEAGPADLGAASDAGHSLPNAQVERVEDCDRHEQMTHQTECIQLRITCGGLPATNVKIRVWMPSISMDAGAVIYGMGGIGDGWMVDRRTSPNSAQVRMLDRLMQQGFTVYERAWVDGWWGESAAGAGMIAPACRYAAMVAWLREHRPSSGPFCAFGNSGGSSEISYALTHHRLGDQIRLAVLGGGPPMGRVDLGCQPQLADADWVGQCSRIWTETQTECGRRPIKCSFSGQISGIFDRAIGRQACSAPTGDDLARLSAESVVSDTSVYAYPNTHVHFLHGRQDCTEAPILGTLYWQEITSAKSRTLAEGTPHRTISVAAGARDVIDTVTRYCQ